MKKTLILRLTPEQKNFIVKAAMAVHVPSAHFIREAALDMAETQLRVKFPRVPKRFCHNAGCKNPLTERNKSNFCRGCQRIYGIATLQKRARASR